MVWQTEEKMEADLAQSHVAVSEERAAGVEAEASPPSVTIEGSPSLLSELRSRPMPSAKRDRLEHGSTRRWQRRPKSGLQIFTRTTTGNSNGL